MNKMSIVMHFCGIMLDAAGMQTHLEKLGEAGELRGFKQSNEEVQSLLQSIKEMAINELRMVVDPATDREVMLNKIFEEAMKRGTGKID